MTGFTKEEKFLARLCHDSFLQFWSWPNLFRDQGHCKQGGDGKEICDLTVIFGNNIILFSDKKISYNHQIEINTAWKRWSRKAIRDSVKQVIGAKRWFNFYHDRIYIDKNCTKKLPIDLPSPDSMVFHDIIVCHGIENALIDYNEEPSFRFDNTIHGNAHWEGDECKPFTLGKVYTDTFIHVFNEATISLVLNEFDTANDFISYLKQRESLINSNKTVRVKSESDLIQLYYENFDDNSKCHSMLISPEVDCDEVNIDKGGIGRLYTNQSFVAKRCADKISYFWDDLIQVFSFHALNGTTEHKSWVLPSELEPGLRDIAKLGRFERRVLSESFIDFYNKVAPGERGTRLALDLLDDSCAYLFLLLPFGSSFPSHEEYRRLRREMIEDYCIIAKHLNSDYTKIIGIAAKTRDHDDDFTSDFFSEGQDLIFCDTSDWNEDNFNHAKEVHRQYVENRLFSKREHFYANVSEFPTSTSGFPVFRENLIVKGADRNKPCICGSGKKYKKCCGRL